MIRPLALFAITLLTIGMIPAYAQDRDTTGAIIEPFPILSYDSDTGFGVGAKVVFRNQLGARESFDITAFTSTRGERWYRLAVSFPDGELRHGTEYPLAVDLVVDYDKMISNRYYGIGNDSRFGDREQYTKEPFDASLAFSRGFSSVFVGQLGVRFRAIRNSDFESASKLVHVPDADGRASYTSLFAMARYDSRNSTVNPSTGAVLEGDYEIAPDGFPGHTSLTKYGATVQGYMPLFTPALVLAGRFALSSVEGGSVPPQFLQSIGGNATLRGSTQDRYLDRAFAVLNGELRFPIYRRLAGVAGVDLGRVWPSMTQMGLSGWSMNPAAGLRVIMETFVVRLDVGLGQESTGVYFNFGQLF
jgi:outer membrane protein assembly factor BamA